MKNLILSLISFALLLPMTLFSQDVPELMYYRFDGTGSNVPNEASNPVGNQPAPIVGNLTQGGTGQFGGALNGTGSSSASNNLNTGWSPNLGNSDWTISVWFGANIPQSTTLYYFFGETNSSFRCFTGGVAGSGGLALRGGGLTDVYVTNVVGSNPVVITYVYSATAGNVKVYENGQHIHTQSQGTISVTGTGTFWVGGQGSNGLSGSMDEFRFYNRALDSTEIMDTWDEELPLKSSPNDAGVIAINQPNTTCVGTHPVEAVIKNFGLNQIDTVTVGWSLNGVPQPPLLYTQLLDTANGTGPNIDTVLLGNVTLTSNVTENIAAWTSMPNNEQDTVTGNDTTYLSVKGTAYPTPNLGPDTTICPGDSITINVGPNLDSIFWSTSPSNSRFLTVGAQGTYHVEVYKKACAGEDSMTVTHFPAPPNVEIGNDTLMCWDDSILLDATTSGVTYLWHDNSTSPTQYAAQPGFYWVEITDANTCTSADSMEIKIHKTPSVTIAVAPSNNICYGDVFTFRANGKSAGSIMYQWKVNGVNSGPPTTSFSFKPTDLGYADTVTVDLLTDLCAGGGTDAYSSNGIVMFINPEPQVISNIQGIDTVLENTSKTYAVPQNTSSTYLWRAKGGTINGDSASNIAKVEWGVADPNASITLIETNSNCTRPNELPVVVISVVGIEEENYIGIGQAYPNPASNTLRIPVYAKRSGRIQLELVDMTGKKVRDVYNGQITSDRFFELDVQDLEEGMYFYRIQTAQGYSTTKKVTIRH